MQKFVFGAKSELPSNTRLSNGYTLFDWVVRQNCFPAFWGRPISGNCCLSKEEIDFLRKRRCGILALFNDFTVSEIATNNGREAAGKAVSAAKRIGIKEGRDVAIFAEIKDGMNVNHNWMLSFAAELRKNGYLSGFLGNTDCSENFNFDSEYSHFVVAGGSAICGATRPQTDEHVYKWFPYAPSVISSDEIAFWQNGRKNFKDIQYETVYAKDETFMKNIFMQDEKEE